MSEFEGILLNMTPVPVVMRKMNSRQMHRERIMFTFDALSKRPESDHPLFVFAHIVCPHPPFVLGPDGKEILSGEFQIAAQGRNGVWPTGADEEKNYVGQITYVNNRLQKIINHLLDNSETSPIIILQGDHGSLFPRDSAGNVKTAYEEKFSILQALYLPGREDISFGDDISPCNSFRVIFNQYFKADFELFENRSYFSSWEEPYRFIDVSEVVGRSARDTIAVDD
ncbi:MAG: hypothetical protein GY841_01395 [FCB group bacterium]|nr:hypothetical protein [FCB group bacterium]